MTRGGRSRRRRAAAWIFAVVLATLTTLTDAGVNMLVPADWGVWPSSQLNQNNLTVDVYGLAFFSTNVSACRVGDFVVPLTYVSSEQVKCTISPSLRLNKGFAYIEVSMNGLDFTSDRNTFTLHEPVKLEQVFPYGWDKAGGGILRVSGSNFAKGSSQCTFGAGGTGTVPAVSTLSPSEVVSSAFMKCETPIFSSKGMTDVSIRSWGTSGSLSGSRAFQVWSEPCSIEVSNSWDVNSTLAERGGLSVLLQGKGNEELVEPLNMFGYSCHFGTVTVSAVMDTLMINGTVTCISPASPRPSTYVDLWTGPNIDTFQPCTSFPQFFFPADSEEYYDEVIGDETTIIYTGTNISAVPTYVDIAGGSVISLTGTSLSNSSICRVGTDVTAPVRFVSSALIQCEISAHSEGEANIYASPTSSVEVTSIYFVALAEVSSLQPATGILEGGTSVRVRGSNFKDTDDLKCQFGTISVLASYFSTTQVDCVSPAHSIGTVLVGVGRRDGTSLSFIHSSSHSFIYDSGDILGAVMPSVVRNVGDTTLSLVWSLVYTVGTGCRVSGVLLDPCTVSGSTTAGFVEVYSYSFASDESVTEPAEFAYYTSPVVSGSIPVVVQTLIPTVVHVLGTDFIDEANVYCAFGENAVDATFVSSALVKCTSHLPATGNIDAKVGFGSASDDGVWSRTVVSLSSVSILTMSSISPSRGVFGGGTSISVTGTGFDGVGVVYCRIGTVSYVKAKTIHDKQVQCTSPSSPSYFDGTVDIQVAILGNVYTETSKSFIYSTGVEVVTIVPPLSPLFGNNDVSIFGLAGDVGGSYDCVVSGSSATGTVNRFGEVECVAPAGAEGFAPVGIGSIIDDVIDQQTLAYVRLPVIRSIYRFNGPTSGGTLIHIAGEHLRESSYLSLDSGGGVGHFYSSALIVSELSPSTANVYIARVKANGNLTSNALTFTSRAAIGLTSISPSGIATSGGSVVSVTGSNIPNDNSLSCSFGTIMISALWSSSTTATCVSPVHLLGTTTPFRMHADGLASGSTTVAYVSTSTISKLLPPSLSSTELPGAVAVYGSWLASASCDGKVLPLSTSWAAEYSCTIDPVSVGFTTVSTITRGQTLSVSYLIKKTPLLLNVNPSGATTLPDEIITLSTQHFIGDDDQFHCLFDAEKSVVPHIISSGLVRCESIATTKVSTQLTIEGGDGAYPLSRQGVPSASTVSPQTSGGIGGTLITITGTNIPIIDNSAVCSFGSIGPISSQYVTSTKVTCVSPAGVTSTNATICVSVFSVLSPSKSCDFTHNTTYSDVLGAVMPSVVRNVGDTTLSLVWSLVYTVGTGCRVSGVLLDPCTVSGSTTAGFVEVYSYSFASDESVTEPAEFAYYTSPVVSGSIPVVVQTLIPTVVHVLGTDFIDEANVYCAFGENAVDATFVSSALVKCTSHLPATGNIDAKVGFGSASDDGVWSRTVVSLSSVSILTMSSISPSRGVFGGGTSISVTGTGFDGVGVVYCRIGTVSYVKAKTIHDKQVQCTSPSSPSYFDGTVDIQVAILGNVYTETSKSFIYSTGVEVVTIVPPLSPLFGNNDVSIFGLAGDVGGSYDCVVSGSSATGTVNRFGEVECVAPAGAEGFAPVGIGSIIDDVIDQQTLAYVRLPVIRSIYRFNGPTSGGTLIHIAGEHLRESSYLSLDSGGGVGHFYSSALIVSELSPSTANVYIARVKANGNLTSNALTFTSRAAIGLTSISPSGIATSGGSVVSVTGSNIPNDNSLSCSFGTIMISALWSSSTTATCVSPVHLLGTTTPFRMHADGLASGSTTVAYVSTSTISKLLPPSLSSTELPGAVAVYGSWLASASCDGKVLPLSTSWAAEYSCTIDPVSVGFTTVSTITRGQTLSVSYLIKKTPLLLNVNPSGATTLPDEIITLSTQHFIGDDDQFHCLFDAEKSVVPHIISSGLVRCESIATTKVSTQLTIEGGDGAYPLSRQGVPSASTVSPQTSGGIGGTLITITGTNIPIIDNSAVCSFGSIGPISSQYVTSTKVTCVSPAGVTSTNATICVSVFSVLSPSKSCTSTLISYVGSTEPPIVLGSGIASKRGGYLSLWRDALSYSLVPTLSTIQVGRENATLSPTISGVYIVSQQPGGFKPVSATADVGGISFSQVMVQPVATIIGASPKFTHVGGGGQVWISGKHLKTDVLRVSLDEADIAHTVVSSGLLVVEVPQHDVGGATIKAGLGNQKDSSGVGIGPFTSTGIDYVAEISMDRVNPQTGPEAGTTSVSFTGTGFTDTSMLGCRFGTVGPITATYVHAQQLRCTTPNHAPTDVPVTISINGRDYAFASLVYSYTAALSHISAVIPAQGPINVVTEYTIYGGGLSTLAGDYCSSLNVTSRKVSSTSGSITCSWPSTSTAGFVQVGVYAIESTYARYDSSQTQFEYFVRSTLTSVEPLTGPTDGGTVLFLSGTNFRSDDASEVTFDGTAVTARVVSSALTVVESPTFSIKGAKTIYASPHNHAPSTSFTALDQLLLSTVSPAFSPVQGGASLEVSGDKFSAPSTLWCRAGTIGPFYARAYDSRLLRCISPAHKKENVHLQVSMNKRDWRYELTLSLANPALPPGTSYNSILNIDYAYPAKIRDVLPRGGHLSDQTAVVEAFYDAPYPPQNVATRGCLTGATSLTSEASDTSGVYSMLCTLQRDSFLEGMYPLIASGPDAANTSFSATFHYVPAPTVDAWEPEVIHTGGGTLVSVILSDAVSDGLVCMFSPWNQNSFSGSTAVDAHFLSSSLIMCESPYAAPLTEIGLTAGLSGSTSEDGQAELSSINRPGISTIEPTSLFLAGGTTIKILGTDLGQQVYDLHASFGSISPLALRWVTGAEVEAISPATYEGEKTVFLSHSLSARSLPYTTALEFFSPFQPSPLIPSVVPAKDNAFVRLHARIGSLHSSVPTCISSSPTFTLCKEAVNIGGILTRTTVPRFEILTIPGTNLTANVPQIAYIDTASSLSVQPSIAVTGGGTVGLVTGKNFVEGVTAVRLGNVVLPIPQGSNSFMSSAVMRFEAPEGTDAKSARLYTSTAYTDSESWGTPGGEMTFYGLPMLTNTTGVPLEVLEGGGTVVLFTGAGFQTNTDLFCKFGEIHIRATYERSTAVSCTAPALEPRSYPLRVSNNMLDYSRYANVAGDSTDVDLVTESKPDFVDSIEYVAEDFGPTSGGTITDVKFNSSPPSALACKFFSRLGNGIVDGSTLAACVTPASDANFVPVQLALSAIAGTEYKPIGVQFEFKAAPEIDMLFPESATSGGGTMINVHGNNLVQSVQVTSQGSTLMPGTTVTGLSCRFGGLYTVAALSISSTIMRCETPPFGVQLEEVLLGLDLSLNAREWTESQIDFEPIKKIDVNSLSPSAGSRGGGSQIIISSGYYSTDTSVWCKFGTTGPIHAVFNGDGSVGCISPAKGQGDVPIAISHGNVIDFDFNESKIFRM